MPQTKIGLEIHGYLKTAEKLFSQEAILLEAEPNTTISPITTGLPGSKPMAPNRQAVEKVFAIAALLQCTINRQVVFYRKHYEWPDMPTGYQRTMSGTYANHPGEQGMFLGIGIEEVHLEEDPARWDPEQGTVDYNKSGYPLVEIVTKPDFTDAVQVQTWLKKLMIALSYIDVLDARSGIKADVNVSLEPDFQRVEIKNVHSFKSIVRAIQSEVARQQEVIAAGKRVQQETRAWNEKEERTIFMRSKEHAIDYCFIVEPDILPVHISEQQLKAIKASLPETPEEKAQNYVKMGIAAEDVKVLSSDLQLADLFELVAKKVSPVLAAKWIRREVLRVLHYHKKELQEAGITAEHLIDVLQLVEEKKITENVAQKLLEKLIEEPFDVKPYVKEQQLETQQDSETLKRVCQEVITENVQAVADFKQGEEKALHFLVGHVMRKTKGTASPDTIVPLLKALLQ